MMLECLGVRMHVHLHTVHLRRKPKKATTRYTTLLCELVSDLKVIASSR